MAYQEINNNETGLAVRTKINEQFSEIYGLIGTSSSFSFINSADDFPAAVGGVHTLPAGSSYYITTSIDLAGNRLACAGDCAIVGSSPEISKITSTGLGSGVPLISSNNSLTLSRVAINDVDTALILNASATSGKALDWIAVNFEGVDNVGTITTYDNFIGSFIGLIDSSNMTFAGTFGTIAFSDSLFNTDASGTALVFDAGLTVTRRIRISDSSFVTEAGETSINLPVAATVPTDGYILNRINFSGGGTYLSGVQVDSLEADFSDCVGITNTTYAGAYSMQNNSTATVISSAGVAVKVAGTTAENSLNQKWSHTDNRLTYVGAQTKYFKFDAPISFTCGNNKKVGFYVAKNGAIIAQSELYRTTSGSSSAASLNVQWFTVMETNDYLEIWVENDTDTTNVTVLSMTPIATEQ